ncbi:MAG TPA: CARDB domain-containing protein [Candidatus Paceibacterota bacterium]|nr:CARDB domain-containing protein [Candidatus Paceibacterota bacterium]
MENSPKRSKALIITIIVVILLLLVGYFLYKNRDSFGVKTSGNIAKIFEPLISSINSKNVNRIDENGKKTLAQAGEDIKKGDAVSAFGAGTGSNLVVVKSTDSNNIYGYANQDINNGEFGEIILSGGGSNNFWDSFSGFLDNVFNNQDNSCINGADNFPACSTVNGACLNGATNPPSCTSIPGGGSCINGAINPPECTVQPGGGGCVNGAMNPPECTILPGSGGCVNGADNPELCTTIGGSCINGAVNPPECTTGGDPDLTITTDVTPMSTTVNTPTTLSSTIINIGGGSTLHSFSSIFSIDSVNDSEVIVTVVPTLEAKIGSVATISYTFPQVGEYSVRVCADKNSASDTGTVPESNEGNNCGPFTIIKVENSLPTTGDLTQCSDTIDNDGDGAIDALDPNCHTNGDLTDAYIPEHYSESTSPVNPNANNPQCSDTIDNDGDKTIDALDPNCHMNSDLTQAYIPTHTSETVSPVTPNACLDIDQYPLEFTDQEKADLAELLRKFYLIAPNLRTEDDIEVAYSDIIQYQNFSEHLGVLINQCYLQTNDRIDRAIFCANKSNRSACAGENTFADQTDFNYTGPTTRWGNPWYQWSTNRGSYGEDLNITPDQYDETNISNPADLKENILNLEKILNVW